MLDVPFGKVRVKTPKNGLELLSEASDVTVFKVVSQVVKGAELVFDFPVFENDASVGDKTTTRRNGHATRKFPLQKSDGYISE